MMRFLLLVLLAACQEKTDPQLEPAVEFPGHAPITVRDFRRAMARMRLQRESADPGPLPAELVDLVLERLIEQRLLAIEAERVGVKASTTAVALEIAAMRRALPERRFERFLTETYQTQSDVEKSIAERLVANAMVAREVTGDIPDADVERAWNELPADKKIRRARVHAAQIMVQTEEIANGLLKQLRTDKTADFAAVARANSVGPEREQSGDLGWFEKGHMPAIFDQICFTLAPGQISEVTPSELGYHIFKVFEREEERPLTFDEAKPALLDELRAERMRTKERELVKSLMEKNQVIRHYERIAESLK
jgi:parvulin-like peptidyl-prolyl isomerase